MHTPEIVVASTERNSLRHAVHSWDAVFDQQKMHIESGYKTTGTCH